MEGYPYIHKVASSIPPFQESTSNGDKSTTANANFEQPVYEQLMPSTLVAVGPYPCDASIAAAFNNIATSNVVPENTSSTGTYSVDPYSSSAGGNTCTLQHFAPTKQTPNHAPAVQNGQQQVDDVRNEAVEPPVCNGTSLSEEDVDVSIPSDSCTTKLSSPLSAEGQLLVPEIDTIEVAIKEANVDEPSKSRETIQSVKINDDSAISNERPVNEDELQGVSSKFESDRADHITPSKANDITSVDEKVAGPIDDEDDENSSDTVISDSCPDATDSGNVFSLFKNVVLVQAEATSEPDMHSQSESESVDPIVASSVEDIGREEDNEMLEPTGVLIDETEDVHNYETMDGVAVCRASRSVAATDNDNDEGNQHGKTDTNGKSKGNASLVGAKRYKQKTSESHSSGEESLEDESTRPTSQKCQMRKRGANRIVNVEKELSNSKKARSKVSNDDPFGSCASSSSEDVPSDMYFGASDRVFTVSTKLHWQRQKQKGNKYYARTKATDRYDDDASSDEEDEDEEHAQRRAKRAEEIARLKLPAYQQQQLQQLVLKKHPKRDRFYDRSQDIPNDIYFGNVKVPLHILHASSSSSSEEEPWTGGSGKSASGASCYHKRNHNLEYRQHKESAAHAKSSNHRYSRSSSSRAESTCSQGGTRSVHRMKEYLKMAGFRHMRYQKLWQGCETNHERAEAILRFLQDHGLQGEPTDEKCRELRKEIQLQKEVEVLDTSVIIGSGEGRVTRQRAKKVSETTGAETSESHPPEPPQKDEQPVEASAASVPSETVELERKCEEQQQHQQLPPNEENNPSEKAVEHVLPPGDINRSNSPSNE